MPNLVLRQLGSVTATDIPRVPLTLGAGTYQLYAVNGSTFSNQVGKEGFTVTVAAPPVSISNYTWNTTPRPGQPFGGTVNGTGFVPVGTQVWFCVSGTATCYQQPAAGITINNSTSLTLSNVNLGAGSWQFYVRTAAGQSARSAAFTVQAALPTITSYSWSTVPTAGQPFSGTILGTGFVSGGTQVWFCVNSTNTCYQQPAAGVTVTSRTSLNVSNVNLGGGTWQIFVRTAAGQSARSTVFTVQAAPLPTITGYTWSTTPKANQPFSGTISGTGFVSGGTQVWFCVNGSTTCYQHPAAGITVSSSTSLGVSGVNLGAGTWQFFVRTAAGQSVRSTAFTVQAPTPPPTLTGYSWNTTPKANQPFGGTVTGTGFVSGGTQVWFCVNGSTTCYQHPAAGVNVNSSTSLTVSGVNLGAGTWQLYVKTSAGPSGRSAAFTVQAPTPTVTGYSWNTTPTVNQSFGGTVTGTGFVAGGTQVWFCVSGSGTCYQHPAAGVTVSSSTSLSVSGVNLGAGAWQLYVQTSAGQSTRSTTFTVQAASPTIAGYSWNTTPRPGQPFGGTISGSGFVPGGTQVWFCVSGTGTCYQQPAAGVNVNSSTNLTVSGVNLGSGWWQFYVQTSAGQSGRSASFNVQAGAPTISGYSWSTTPAAGQPFGGTIFGTDFITGGTRVWFCIYDSATCYEHPAAGVNVNSSSNLSVNGVNLGNGWWQFFLQSSAGQSPRSTPFSVR